MNVSKRTSLGVIAVMMLFASTGCVESGNTLPEVPGQSSVPARGALTAESIINEHIGEMNNRIARCADVAVAEMGSARNATALKSLRNSAREKCLAISLPDLDAVISKRVSDARVAEKEPCQRRLGCDAAAIDDRYNPIYEDYLKRKQTIEHNANQQIQAAVEAASARLTAAYDKRLPEATALEVADKVNAAKSKALEAEARRNESEKFAAKWNAMTPEEKASYKKAWEKRIASSKGKAAQQKAQNTRQQAEGVAKASADVGKSK